MQARLKPLKWWVCGLLMSANFSFAATTSNQTDDLSPIFSEERLPFTVTVEEANFRLPQGIHSGAAAVFQGKWIFIGGRTNGLHGFGVDPFPVAAQNRIVYVVDPLKGSVASRSLEDPASGLSQQQVDSLSVTSPQSFQEGTTLYIVGGYGGDRSTNTFGTKSTLTAIYIPAIVQWVLEPNNKNISFVKNIRQISNPIFQIAGGRLYKSGENMQLIFGQNFTGVYTPGSNGDYSQQVRIFKLTNARGQLGVEVLNSKPNNQDPVYRRRDMNILPVLLNTNNLLQFGHVAYSGVFTLAGGIWTVPVVIDANGVPTMSDPVLPSTFKQGMNNYVTASAGLYSQKNASMYNIFFGGMSYGFYDSGTFQTDAEIPFINQITTVKIDKNRNFTQYLMNNEYPVIPSETVNPGNPLLFGSGGFFIPSKLSQYANGVLNLDAIRQPTVIGHVVGGIASTVPNTSTDADSFASPYVFKVILTPR